MKGSARAAVLAGLLVPLGLFACLWVKGTTLTGGSKTFVGRKPARELQSVMARKPMYAFEALHNSDIAKAGDAFSDREMEAVGDVLAGRLAQGIARLEALETNEPGHYSVAANLGTAYELNGGNTKALKWISEGIRRNPDSHGGTEWLHELVLQAKLELEKDPGWLKDHRILALDEARFTASDYRLQAGGRALSVPEIVTALDHQLTERMLLVKPKDPVVADLLYTYGVLEAHTSVVESALELMQLSKEYGFSDPALMERQVRRYERVILLGRVRPYAIGIAIVGALYYCRRRKWFFWSIKEYRAYQAAQVGKS